MYASAKKNIFCRNQLLAKIRVCHQNLRGHTCHKTTTFPADVFVVAKLNADSTNAHYPILVGISFVCVEWFWETTSPELWVWLLQVRSFFNCLETVDGYHPKAPNSVHVDAWSFQVKTYEV